MLKIQMLKSQPRPGAFPALPCYLAGKTYTLATEAEVAMGKQFLADGVAVAVSGLVPHIDVSVSLDVTEADKASVRELVQDGKVAEAKDLLMSKVKVKAKPAKAKK